MAGSLRYDGRVVIVTGAGMGLGKVCMCHNTAAMWWSA